MCHPAPLPSVRVPCNPSDDPLNHFTVRPQQAAAWEPRRQLGLGPPSSFGVASSFFPSPKRPEPEHKTRRRRAFACCGHTERPCPSHCASAGADGARGSCCGPRPAFFDDSGGEHIEAAESSSPARGAEASSMMRSIEPAAARRAMPHLRCNQLAHCTHNHTNTVHTQALRSPFGRWSPFYNRNHERGVVSAACCLLLLPVSPY